MSRYLTEPFSSPTLVIEALDDVAVDGAHHLYEIRGFNSETNASCPFQARYGAPALHSTVLFQNGPIGVHGPNGVTHEALLAILIDRLECYQGGSFACEENAVALDHLREALAALTLRTYNRTKRGVEGTNQP